MTREELIFISIYIVCHKLLQDLILLSNTQKLNIYHNEWDLFSEALNKRINTIKSILQVEWLPALILSFVCVFVYPKTTWYNVPNYYYMNLLLAITAILVWKFISSDNDLGTGEDHSTARIILLFSFLSVFINPGFFPLFFSVGFFHFRNWQHHNQMPLRILQNAFALIFFFALNEKVLHLEIHNEKILFIVISSVWAFHYWVPFAMKVWISIRDKSNWIIKNDLQDIVLTAHYYGWWRNRNNNQILQMYFFVKKTKVFLQFMTMLVEGSALFILFHPTIFVFALLFTIFMHVIIFVVSGILFWENILTNILLLIFLQQSPELIDLFSWKSGLVFIAISFVMVGSGLVLWRPKPLAWWETNYVGKNFWSVQGVSGKWYGLYNDFMDPHEYAFGRFLGDELVRKPLMFQHLGQVKKFRLKVAIDHLRGQENELSELVNKEGKSRFEAQKYDSHFKYMTAFIENFNAGMQKKAFGWWPAWLKAPGAQYYHNGVLDTFQGQEKIRRLVINYEEVIWHEEHWKVLHREGIGDVDFF